jgi:sporulation protein YlmC with PRC-barrel domain
MPSPDTKLQGDTTMMDIPINAKVLCANGSTCGHTTYVVLNPVTERMTHVVVKRGVWPHDERLVPIELVTESAQDHVRLSCSQDDLAEMDTFIETEFVESEVTQYLTDPYVITWPFRFSETERVPIEHERIPVGELAVRRGARVEASDGFVGHVEEFLVDATSEHITHLVLREGHLWGQKDVTIPVSHIQRIEENTVYLKMDKAAIEALPMIPVK